MQFWLTIQDHWGSVTAAITAIGFVLSLIMITWILAIKKDSMSAVAWCLTVLLLPYFGALLFLIFGYQRVYLPLARKRKHRRLFRQRRVDKDGQKYEADSSCLSDTWAGISRLAVRLDGSPLTKGNRIAFYHEGQPAYDAMLEAIRSAAQNIHLEYFIFQPDATGQMFIEALSERARNGVEVRLLYDAMGSYRLTRKLIRRLEEAGGLVEPFFPLLNPLRKRTQINMRNHRKILIVDGKSAFTGGLNIGDEYLGKDDYFGYWRDTNLRVEGPAAADLQSVFIEDWDFASGEFLQGEAYFPSCTADGPHLMQVVHSGPDQQLKSIREIYFAGIMRARQRLWIASPYFVPDAGLHDALILAAHSGIDVRFLGLQKPDKWLPFLAGRYYWREMLEAGVKIYQYAKGMMHSKLMLIDGEWATVGTANMDNRSLHLNFEVNCLLYDSALVAELEAAFLRDLESAVPINPLKYRKRPFATRLVENVSRLFSPIL